mgnify:CR=1 FL=1
MSRRRRRLERRALEERRIADVGRVVGPLEALAGRHRQRSPPLVAVEDRAHTARGTSPTSPSSSIVCLDLALGRPDVLAGSTGCPCVSDAERLASSGPPASGRRARRRRRAAATPGSWRGPATGCGPRSSGCPLSTEATTRFLSLTIFETPARAADRCCRCRWCSRSRRC